MTKQEEKDREKQIDLMVECMFDYARTLVDIKTATEDSRFINGYKDTLRDYANFLYDNNYRKIPENAVVLTKEKYDHLIDIINLGWLPEPRDWAFRVELVKEQARKETAKEILQDLLNCCALYGCATNSYILEQAEKYGVEVE